MTVSLEMSPQAVLTVQNRFVSHEMKKKKIARSRAVSSIYENERLDTIIGGYAKAACQIELRTDHEQL